MNRRLHFGISAHYAGLFTTRHVTKIVNHTNCSQVIGYKVVWTLWVRFSGLCDVEKGEIDKRSAFSSRSNNFYNNLWSPNNNWNYHSGQMSTFTWKAYSLSWMTGLCSTKKVEPAESAALFLRSTKQSASPFCPCRVDTSRKTIASLRLAHHHIHWHDRWETFQWKLPPEHYRDGHTSMFHWWIHKHPQSKVGSCDASA